MGTLSLILAVRNGANYLGEALASAVMQSRRPDEIIVVDDGSTDATGTIARGFGDIVCLRQEPRGLAAAQNVGISRAKGTFICFLDHDDLLPPDSIALRLALLSKRDELAYVYGTVEQFISPDLGPEQKSRLPARLQTLTGRMTGASLFRRSAFERVGAFASTLRMGYMMEWVSRAEAAGMNAASIQDVVLRRRVHATNSVHDTQTLETEYLRALRMALRHKRADRRADARPA
ncbi:MAG TPA: glycosyltransferase family A protein [Rhizomicrobium sp.]|jgi:glycosyltransferase involved in cell wall biosynthesis|nr:glycosyltransferase family A protein [Rhizomicrobium sp.]